MFILKSSLDNRNFTSVFPWPETQKYSKDDMSLLSATGDFDTLQPRKKMMSIPCRICGTYFSVDNKLSKWKIQLWKK